MYPCGEEVCKKVCTHTTCSFITLPHKIGEKALTVMQVLHDNQEGLCSRHETVGKDENDQNQWKYHGSQAHCAKVLDATSADYGQCKCYVLGFHPNGTPINDVDGNVRGNFVSTAGPQEGDLVKSEYDQIVANPGHLASYAPPARTQHGVTYPAHDG